MAADAAERLLDDRDGDHRDGPTITNDDGSSSMGKGDAEATAPEKAEFATAVEVEAANGGGERPKRCCGSCRFEGHAEAQGYALMTAARGGIIMSNIFLSTAFITLAEESAGCDTSDSGAECDAKVFGFRPTSLISMIAVVSGVLSAFLLPIIGAVVDYTPYRRAVGILSALFITAVQGVQIWLTDATWFAMSILQAVNGFMYMVQVLAVYAYLPDIGRDVGESKMLSFSALFTMTQFGCQVAYLIVNLGVQIGLKLKSVPAAQVSQGICVVWLFVAFVPGWRKMPAVPALHVRPEGKGLVRIGFGQNWKTLKGVARHYRSGLGWFFLAVVFAEAGANAFTVVAVTFMVGQLDMSGTQVGIVFLITLISTLPGSKLGQLVAARYDPIVSWKINLVVFSAITVAGSLVLIGPNQQTLCYLFGVLWGVQLGWFYPLENVVFTLGVPRGQESEFSGFYTYCRSILTWCPPLIFTVMNESGLHMKWGLMSLVIFLAVGLGFLQAMDPWEDVLEAAKTNKMKETAFVSEP